MANITVSATIADFMDSADATAARTAIAAGTVATTDSTLALLSTPGSIIVNATGTDTERGTKLLAAYAAAKILTPNGAALSATNRAAVIIPPGKYKVATTFVLDGEFVDLMAQFQEPPSRRRETDNDIDPNGLVLDLTSFRPGKTLIYTEAELTNAVEQTADDVRLSGFSIAQLGSLANFVDLGVPEWGAFFVGDCDNTPSEYVDMYFWCGACTYAVAGGVRSWESFGGTWIRCVSNGASFRVGYGDQNTPSAVFSAQMTDCDAGPYSYAGDYFPGRAAFYSASGCRLVRCRSIGLFNGGELGASSFAACSGIGLPIDDTCWFIDCEGGDICFGLGVSNAGNFLRCRAGASSFGGSNTSSYFGTFTGYAEDCIAGGDSFGGRTSAMDASNASCYCSGTLVRCTVTGSSRPINLSNAKIRDSRFTVTTTGQDCFKLLNSNSQITNSELIVLQGGTGRAINASSALNVVAVNLRLNNATNDADGLGSNVTNLVASAGNVVSNSIT